MNALAHSEDLVLFGTSILPVTNNRLQFAVASRHTDNSEAENLLWEARAEDPTCLPVYFALYKFYANSNKLDRAERAARLALAESARQAGVHSNWEKLSQESQSGKLYASDVAAALDEPARYDVVILEGDGVPIVLNREEVLKANPRIMQTYGIPSPRNL